MCESFQQGEGPDRGLPRDCTTPPINRLHSTSLFLSPSSRRRITSPPSSKLYPRKETVCGTRPPLGRHVTVTQSGDVSPENTGAAEYTIYSHDNCAVLKFLLPAISPLLLVQQLKWQFRVAAPTRSSCQPGHYLATHLLRTQGHTGSCMLHTE